MEDSRAKDSGQQFVTALGIYKEFSQFLLPWMFLHSWICNVLKESCCLDLNYSLNALGRRNGKADCITIN